MRTLILPLILTVFFFQLQAAPPAHNLGDGNLNTCSASIYDFGGSTGNYGDDQDIIETYCSDNGSCIVITFNSFSTESCCDWLKIYDGPNTSSTLIGTYQGTSAPGIITATSGCVTFEFHSDYSVSESGWEAEISCGTCPGNNVCSALNADAACGAKIMGEMGNFSDSGIPDPGCGNYQGGDVWFKASVVASGNMNFRITDVVNGITDAAMAIYSGTFCSGPLTLLGCDDNSGVNNMPEISLSGQTPGDTLYIRIWEPGNDEVGSFELEVTDIDLLFCLTDDAEMYNLASDTCVQVTSNVNSQKGCAWYKNTLDFSESFDHALEIYCGNDDGGADGMTFTFHNDPQGTNECGNDGQYLGAGGIENALVIEIDTWDNGGIQELSADHIAIWTSNSGEGSPIAGPVQASSTSTNIEDGQVHELRIVWDAGTQTLSVYFDGVSRLSVSDDFITNVFGSKNVFWGSTGSTGGANNQHYVCPPSSLIAVPLPVDISVEFMEQCNGETTSLSWILSGDKNCSLQGSDDGVSFINILDQIKGVAQGETFEYNCQLEAQQRKEYYRTYFIENGKKYYSPILHSYCNNIESDNIKIYPNPIKDQITVYIDDNSYSELEFGLYNVIGEEVLIRKISVGINQVRIDIDPDLPEGIYMALLKSNHSFVYQKVLMK